MTIPGIGFFIESRFPGIWLANKITIRLDLKDFILFGTLKGPFQKFMFR
jgi:hypothetical protein